MSRQVLQVQVQPQQLQTQAHPESLSFPRNWKVVLIRMFTSFQACHAPETHPGFHS